MAKNPQREVMTEYQARKKWCPQAFQKECASDKTSVNRDVQGKPIGECLGSRCMMWTWAIKDETGYCSL